VRQVEAQAHQVAVTARVAVIPQAALTAVIRRVARTALAHRVSRRAVIPPATQALPRQVGARSPVVPLIHTAFEVGMNAFSAVAVPVNLKAGSQTMNGRTVIGVDCLGSFGIDQLSLTSR
jgi:hypothetical protein